MGQVTIGGPGMSYFTATYSSWTRNRLTPEARERIRDAGPGRCWFTAAVGRPRGWVGCTVVIDEARAWGVGPDPLAAFEAALSAHTEGGAA